MHRGDEPRRAEAALASVAIHHRFLDRRECAADAKALDGDHVGAVKLENEGDARVDRSVLESVRFSERITLRSGASHQYGASSAVAFVADDFGARFSLLQSQPIGERQHRVVASHLAPLAVQVANHMLTVVRHVRRRLACD